MRLHLIVYILLLLFSLQVTAAPTYFCTDAGTTLGYVRKYVESGEVKWYHTLKIESQSELHDGATAVYTLSEFKDSEGKEIFDKPVSQRVKILSNGDIMLNLTSAVVALLQSTLPSADTKTDDSGVLLPATVRPGDILPSAEAEVAVLGLKYRVKVTDRKVLRYETITTPAGTFNCIVISEHKVEKAPFYKRETTALSWYSDGVGYVRHDTYDKNMVLETSEQLYSIER